MRQLAAEFATSTELDSRLRKGSPRLAWRSNNNVFFLGVSAGECLFGACVDRQRRVDARSVNSRGLSSARDTIVETSSALRRSRARSSAPGLSRPSAGDMKILRMRSCGHESRRTLWAAARRRKYKYIYIYIRRSKFINATIRHGGDVRIDQVARDRLEKR